MDVLNRLPFFLPNFKKMRKAASFGFSEAQSASGRAGFDLYSLCSYKLCLFSAQVTLR